MSGGWGGGVPAGAIVLWSGTVAAIPNGWALCDGTQGTPDLRDRFVVGLDVGAPASGGTASPAAALATHASHTAVITHTHGYEIASAAAGALVGSSPDATTATPVTADYNTLAPAGAVASAPHDVHAAYKFYRLAYIQRL